ncbi:type VI secretion system accessory protein TagJ [Massilia sp. DJPM01]|uniref:type VI secretion system accessory protein TagJ n=1 Tax=Massilia sp. DJPM01 TaxID=3024404 RepID=UPI00259FBB2A|nr:type VI secretion system accessory protein TagJ [Massilia sp. DJPM01]MDM5175697.1 type VI secretion system accessory protein TagJ [Massilia sp. DJPM01]
MNQSAIAEVASLDEEYAQLKERIRRKPEDPDLRAQLFQVLALRGDWLRAQAALTMTLELNPNADSLAGTYLRPLACELVRAQVFAGARRPDVCEADAAVECLADALQLDAGGSDAQAGAVRAAAMAELPARSGHVRLHGSDTLIPFAWLADGDSRFGPVLELFAGERYLWLPLAQVQRIRLVPATSRCALVWSHGAIDLVTGKKIHAALPVRYPLPAKAADQKILTAAYTEWQALAGADQYTGIGQRMLVTDQGEYALLDIAEIVFELDDAQVGNA